MCNNFINTKQTKSSKLAPIHRIRVQPTDCEEKTNGSDFDLTIFFLFSNILLWQKKWLSKFVVILDDIWRFKRKRVGVRKKRRWFDCFFLLSSAMRYEWIRCACLWRFMDIHLCSIHTQIHTHLRWNYCRKQLYRTIFFEIKENL